MAGIYLHIPYCKQACHYCDFHFSTNTHSLSAVEGAMQKELELERNFLEGQVLKTIYFGGGTPSLLPQRSLGDIFETLHKFYDTSSVVEITLEANPDDINKENLKFWQSLGINRFSIGVQSFHQLVLEKFNRAHKASEAEYSVKLAQDAGFENISIDLIYGHPWLSELEWQAEVLKAIALEVPHISAYSLTIEPKTAFGKWLDKGLIPSMDEEVAASHLELLWELTEQNGFEAYEISNFAKAGFESKHNSSYWSGAWYLGIGPSAHSFNGVSRRWNVANNALYTKSLAQNAADRTEELLSENDRINEYFLTNLRRSSGVSFKFLRAAFNFSFLDWQQELMASWQLNGLALVQNDCLLLTKKGKLLADNLSAALFLV